MSDFWEYDPAADKWTQKASLPLAGEENRSIGFSIGNKGYAVFTYCCGPEIYEYDAITNSWLGIKTNHPVEVMYNDVGTSSLEKGYIFTSNRFLEFTPPQD